VNTYNELLMNNRSRLADYATLLINLIYDADARGDDDSATGYREIFRNVMDSIHAIDREVGEAV